jgi:hypothetical protein
VEAAAAEVAQVSSSPELLDGTATHAGVAAVAEPPRAGGQARVIFVVVLARRR